MPNPLFLLPPPPPPPPPPHIIMTYYAAGTAPHRGPAQLNANKWHVHLFESKYHITIIVKMMIVKTQGLGNSWKQHRGSMQTFARILAGKL
eukprot:1151388-Pelagomonas_calceolata.AAC.2